MTITVIILNYNRPHNLDKLIPEIVNYTDISEIIISHGRKDTEYLFNHPKIINETKLRNKYYAATRHEVAKLATNDIILHLNDDLIPSEYLVKKLLKKYKEKGENNIYGPYGNTCTIDGVESSSRLPYFPYNGIQIGLALVSKTFSLKIWEEIKKNKEFNIMMMYKGNGEDIIFSNYINKFDGNNIRVKGAFKQLDESNGYSTTNWKNFNKERNHLCKIMHQPSITYQKIIYYLIYLILGIILYLLFLKSKQLI